MNKIIFLILAFISYYLLVLVFGKITKVKFKHNVINISLIILFSILNSLSFIDDLLIVKTIISILLFILVNFFMYKRNIKESIVASIMFLLLSLFAEMIIMLIMTSFNVISEEYLTSVSILKAELTVITTLLVYLIVSYKPINNIVYKIYRFLANDKKYTKYAALTIILITYVCLLYSINYSKKNLFLMNLTFYIGFIALVFLIVRSIYRSNKLNIINQLLIKNEESYLKALESYQLFKHNIIHEFNCIKTVGNKKVNKIIDEYINEHQTPVVDKKVLLFIPKSIRTILYNNIIKNNAFSLDISVDNYIKNDIINTISMNKYIKFSEVFGIIIDNSIEACKNNKDPYLYLYLNEDKGSYYIKVINSFNNNINLLDETKENKSTKKGHMGLGLKYVFNSNFDIKTTIRNNKFITSIMIKK